MSESFRCRGRVGTNQVSCNWQDDDAVLPDGYVWVAENPSWNPGPTRFGQWIVQPDGSFEWGVLPDPPFNVVFHEGKLKNADTMTEITIETLPGNVAARLNDLENPPV